MKLSINGKKTIKFLTKKLNIKSLQQSKTEFSRSKCGETTDTRSINISLLLSEIEEVAKN